MKTAICPGSFDPVTLGHIDIIERAASIFDRTVVLVMQNNRKAYNFTPEERVRMLRKTTAGLPSVTVEWADRLLAEVCAGMGDAVIVKGLRAVSDFEMEFQMALMNRKLNPALDTLFLTASERFQYLSSSVVKEICSYGGDVREFIPEEIHDEVRLRLAGANIEAGRA
ncbi:MAG: pantetheine-phosphate adenylyltransferase [Oscillospiraceae bacterium]|jgi:pantetheine-phosphate adenylyltransferase|nr:pantetheine-phosphate adenylyltransferase [Oscillospiraceae bacterium]